MKHKDFNILPATGGYTGKIRRAVQISTTLIVSGKTIVKKTFSSLNPWHYAFQDYTFMHLAAEGQLTK